MASAGTGWTAAPARVGRWKLPQLSRYVLGQLLGPVALLTLLMTCIIPLTQSFRLLDLVINRGQSAPTFLYLMVLGLPQLLVIILPIAFFAGTLFSLSRLNSDSELVVMASAGYSQRQLATPVLVAAAIIMALTLACSLWLSPAGKRAFDDKVLNINADIGAALLNEGQFNPLAAGLTVFIRSLDKDGQMHGIRWCMIAAIQSVAVTYLAQRGLLAQTPAGARLIMNDGTIEQSARNGAQLTVGTFKTWPISLDQFASAVRPTLRTPSERYLGELLAPTEKGLTAKVRNSYLTEAHSRLSQPLYCIAFALIALAAILRGRRQRGVMAMRMTVASLAAVALGVSGYGLPGAAASHPALNVLFYVIPLVGAAAALLVLMGYSPRAILSRRSIAEMPA